MYNKNKISRKFPSCIPSSFCEKCTYFNIAGIGVYAPLNIAIKLFVMDYIIKLYKLYCIHSVVFSLEDSYLHQYSVNPWCGSENEGEEIFTS